MLKKQSGEDGGDEGLDGFEGCWEMMFQVWRGVLMGGQEEVGLDVGVYEGGNGEDGGQDGD